MNIILSIVCTSKVLHLSHSFVKIQHIILHVLLIKLFKAWLKTPWNYFLYLGCSFFNWWLYNIKISSMLFRFGEFGVYLIRYMLFCYDNVCDYSLRWQKALICRIYHEFYVLVYPKFTIPFLLYLYSIGSFHVS